MRTGAAYAALFMKIYGNFTIRQPGLSGHFAKSEMEKGERELIGGYCKWNFI